MALPQSTLSLVCRGIADFLAVQLNAQANSIRVLIGTPAAAAPSASTNEHRLNLFFYRIEPTGFGNAAATDEIWRVRLHCLVTPFARAENQVSAGENDLRLLGEVVRIFHERPLMASIDVQGEEVRTEVLFSGIGLDDLNHLWSTQGDVPLRPSVAYEISLAPIIPRRRSLGSPLVGQTGAQVYGDMDARQAPFTADGQIWQPRVATRRVHGALEDWAPSICLVHQNQCLESVSFAVGSPALAAFTPRVWIAGPSGSAVTLRWETWDSTQGWASNGPGVNGTASGEMLDPAQVASAATQAVPLPFTNHAGQAVLYAERSYVRGSDGAQVTVRSNPLLVNLHGA